MNTTLAMLATLVASIMHAAPSNFDVRSAPPTVFVTDPREYIPALGGTWAAVGQRFVTTSGACRSDRTNPWWGLGGLYTRDAVYVLAPISPAVIEAVNAQIPEGEPAGCTLTCNHWTLRRARDLVIHEHLHRYYNHGPAMARAQDSWRVQAEWLADGLTQDAPVYLRLTDWPPLRFVTDRAAVWRRVMIGEYGGLAYRRVSDGLTMYGLTELNCSGSR